ncbi:hypothetical protein Tco_0870310 [Tanacetum coccineum]
MENSKRGSISMQEKLKLSKSQGASTPAEVKLMQNVPYALTMGSIIYAIRCTRPDVAFAHNITSRFQQNPDKLHWTAVKNILKYIRNTKDMFLVYKGDIKRELRVSCYTNVGYMTNADDLKTQTGYVFILTGGAVDWKSTKQSILATSSTEAEYITASDASKEAFGDVKIGKVHTNDNLADPFTKVLAFPKYSDDTKNIGFQLGFVGQMVVAVSGGKRSVVGSSDKKRVWEIDRTGVMFFSSFGRKLGNGDAVMVFMLGGGGIRNEWVFLEGQRSMDELEELNSVLIYLAPISRYVDSSRWFLASDGVFSVKHIRELIDEKILRSATYVEET